MKKLFNKLQEMMSFRLLHIILLTSLLLDSLNLKYLTSTYGCSVENISEVIGFYWLSPVFTLVDFLVGVLLCLKAKNSVNDEVHFIDCPIGQYILQINVTNLSLWLHKKVGQFIIIICIMSFVQDIIRFFNF